MEEPILIKNQQYLDAKEKKLNHLRKIQIRKAAVYCRDKLRELPLREHDLIVQTVRSATEDILADDSLSAELCKEIVLQTPEISPLDFLLPHAEEDSGTASISYFRNTHSDEAYRIFSANIKNAVSMYADTSYGCCEDVYTGRAAFCILPICTNKEGLLSAFCAMAEQYDLFVCAIAEVPIPRTEDRTIFALFKRRCQWNENKTYFAFGIQDEFLSELGRILSDLGTLGAVPVRIGELPNSDGNRTLSLIVLNVARANLTTVLLYLEVTVRSYRFLGLFEKWKDGVKKHKR